MNIFGRKLKELRKDLGLTQFEMGEKMGVSYQQIQKYEYGTNSPNIKKIQKIADMFEVPLNYFVEETRAGSSVLRIEEDRLNIYEFIPPVLAEMGNYESEVGKMPVALESIDSTAVVEKIFWVEIGGTHNLLCPIMDCELKDGDTIISNSEDQYKFYSNMLIPQNSDEPIPVGFNEAIIADRFYKIIGKFIAL